jgi:DNA-binding SARP family transcriptional activator
VEDSPEFDDWVTLQQQAWRQRLDRIFEQFSQHQLSSGDITAALTTTQRWLVHDPLHEVAYRRLMQIHSLAGNRVAALEAFETCRQMLADELGAAPTPETINLAERIKDLRLPTVDISTALSTGLRLNEASLNRKSIELPLAGRTTA